MAQASVKLALASVTTTKTKFVMTLYSKHLFLEHIKSKWYFLIGGWFTSK